MATNNAINANSTTPMGVAIGGTGANTLTIHGLLKGDAAGAVSALPAATNGQIPIGSTGADPVLGTITAGAGINVANGPGTITITNTGGGGGGITTLQADDTNTASGSTVTIAGDGVNIFTTADNASTLTVSQGPVLAIPSTNAGLTQGTITQNTNVLYSSFTNGGIPNSFFGLATGNGTNTGQANVCFGYQSMSQLTSGQFNVGTGASALQNVQDGSNNVCYGGSSGALITSGSLNACIGDSALVSLLTGSLNTAVGASAGSSYTSESDNICIMNTGTPGDANVMRLGTTGSGSGQVATTYIAGAYGVTPSGMGIQTVVMDSNGQLGTTSGGGGGITTIAGNTGTATGSTVTFDATSLAGSSVAFQAAGATVQLAVEDANVNTYVGNFSGNLTGTGGQNTGFGHGTMLNFTTGVGNTAIGYNALLGNQDAGLNVALGNSALQTLTTGSGGNTALGTGALLSLASGTNNIGIGNNAGGNYGSTESNNICLGSGGSPGESAVLRLGDFSTQTTAFIGGVAGVTVSNNAAVLIDTTTGQLGTVISSERFKHNIKDMEDKSSAVMNLRPVTFSYKGDATNSMQYGLIAEEVATTMPGIVTYDASGNPYTVRYHELPSILLNEIQKLSKRVEQLEAQLAAKV